MLLLTCNNVLPYNIKPQHVLPLEKPGGSDIYYKCTYSNNCRAPLKLYVNDRKYIKQGNKVSSPGEASEAAV